MKNLITVFNGTGQQGGAVIKALLNDESFTIQAFTRNPNSDASNKLKSLGVCIVQCDESKSKKEIEDALKGSYGVYLVTNTSGYPDKEIEYGCKVADAALSQGVKHFIFSTLCDTKEISNGKYVINDYTNKSKIEKHIRELSKSNRDFICSFVSAPMYYQNFETYYPLTKHTSPNNDETYWSIDLPGKPDLKLDHGDINDIGKLVLEEFKNPEKYNGIVIPLSSQLLTGNELAEIFTKTLGKKVIYNYIPTDVYRKSNYEAADIMATMFDYFHDGFDYFGNFDKSIAKKITHLTTLEEYLKNVNFQLN